MLPHEREHYQHVVFQPAAEPISTHDAATIGWSHPPKSCNDEHDVDPIARLEWLDDLMFAAILCRTPSSRLRSVAKLRARCS